jgi:SAM-dependent methyltransferase
MDEMPRYAVIASYIRNCGIPLSVLDVGCGNGRLVAELSPFENGRYTGIDLSEDAIAQAAAYEDPGVQFRVADFRSWSPEETFGLIVFNDTLYYADHPIAVLERYFDMLTGDGVIVVAMFRHRNTMVIWRDIERRYAVIDRFTVISAGRELTDIRILRRVVAIGGQATFECVAPGTPTPDTRKSRSGSRHMSPSRPWRHGVWRTVSLSAAGSVALLLATVLRHARDARKARTIVDRGA